MRGSTRAALWGLFAWAFASALTLWLEGPPYALATDADPELGSGGRAMRVLKRIARDESDVSTVPRPTGSAANAACRQRIIAELERIGLEPEVQKEFGVNVDQGAAGVVRNIVARVRGTEGLRGEGRAILCMAHYDSVGAGPGISDDLAGVAAWIEVARALRAGELPGRDVIFLFADGEELGLLGAETFAAEHRWGSDVGAVINLEGRGSGGPSRMFETSPENAWAIEAFAVNASRPSATSLSVEVYRRMPNLTDFAVWRRRGVQGLNFAFIGNPAVYHTPLDDFQNLAAATLQHHVTNGLDAVRAMDDARFASERDGRAGAATRGDAAYFDVAGRWLVRSTYFVARVAAFVTLLLAAFVSAMIARRRPTRFPRLVLAFPVVVLSMAASLAVAVLTRRLLGSVGVSSAPWIAHPAPVVCAVVLAAGAFSFASGALARRLVNAHEAFIAVLGILGIATIACAFEFTGVVYVVLVPTFVLAVSLGLALVVSSAEPSPGRRSRFLAFSALPALVSVGIVWAPLHAALIDAFGTTSGLVVAGPLAIGLAILFPVVVATRALMSMQVALTAALLLIVSGVFAAFLPGATAARPAALSFVHQRTQTDDALVAVWHTRGRTETESRWLEALSSDARTAFERVVELDRATPTVEVYERGNLEGARPYAKVRIRPRRAADLLELSARGVSDVIVGGTSVGTGPFRILGPREEGEVLTLIGAARGSSRVVLEIRDVKFGLDGVANSSGGVELLASRDETMAPKHMGDRTVIDARELVELIAR